MPQWITTADHKFSTGLWQKFIHCLWYTNIDTILGPGYTLNIYVAGLHYITYLLTELSHC
jgi:hypothetical protein